MHRLEQNRVGWKRDGAAGFERFSTYRLAIQDGLDKLRKYYSRFDEKPAYILALSKLILSSLTQWRLMIVPIVLHPYYKLDYIQLAGGGEKEQEEERAAGNFAAKNWQDEALRIFEQTVRFSGHQALYFSLLCRLKLTGRAALKK